MPHGVAKKIKYLKICLHLPSTLADIWCIFFQTSDYRYIDKSDYRYIVHSKVKGWSSNGIRNLSQMNPS